MARPEQGGSVSCLWAEECASEQLGKAHPGHRYSAACAHSAHDPSREEVGPDGKAGAGREELEVDARGAGVDIGRAWGRGVRSKGSSERERETHSTS